MSTTELIISILAATILSGTSILFATLGEIITERSGVINLGVEGMMYVGAFTGFLVTYNTGSAALGMCAAAFAAGLFSTLHALIILAFQGSQIVSGLALTILGTGIGSSLGTIYVGKKIAGFTTLHIPFLADIPVLGKIFFQQNALVYISWILVPIVWFFLNRTKLGFSLRAAGENPTACAAAGLNPVRLRLLGIVLGGMFAGLGGAYLSLVSMHTWSENMINGKGWIAVALVVFAFWKPERAVLSAYLFGGITALQLRIQAINPTLNLPEWLHNVPFIGSLNGLPLVLPSSFMSMLPYVLTILALWYAARKNTKNLAPANLGVNIEPIN